MYKLTNGQSDAFQYQLDDFIKQRLFKSLEEKAVQLILEGDAKAGQMTAAALLGYHQTEGEEITRAMKAYYKMFNFKNVEGLLSFWLPNEQCELVLPGYTQAVSHPFSI